MTTFVWSPSEFEDHFTLMTLLGGQFTLVNSDAEFKAASSKLESCSGFLLVTSQTCTTSFLMMGVALLGVAHQLKKPCHLVIDPTHVRDLKPFTQNFNTTSTLTEMIRLYFSKSHVKVKEVLNPVPIPQAPLPKINYDPYPSYPNRIDSGTPISPVTGIITGWNPTGSGGLGAPEPYTPGITSRG